MLPALLGVLGLLCATSAQAFPDKPIRVIVPGEAGGVTDTFARVIQNEIDKKGLLPQPLVVVNMPGAAGAVGIRAAKDARPDGHTMLIFHIGLLTASALGVIDAKPDAFVPVAESGGSCLVYAVMQNAPYDNLKTFLDAARATPDKVREATNIGAIPHLASMQLQKAADVKLRFVQSGGGPARQAALVGGHVEGAMFSLSEFLNARPQGVKALAVLAPERDEFAPDVPTARELGYDVNACVDTWWWVPAGTPPEAVAVLAKAIERAMGDPEVQKNFRSRGQHPSFRTGPELAQKIDRTYAGLLELAPEFKR